MKIKDYKLFLESHQTEESVKEICQKYRIKNWSINSEGLVDVDGSVDLYASLLSEGLTKLPLKFGNITGKFDCRNNQLTSLEGAPIKVQNDFFCCENELNSLEGCPIEVGGYFYCYGNKLTSLEYSPKSVGGDFDCSYNQLTSLVGGPEVVLGYFICTDNKIESFEGFPEDFDRGLVSFDNNPVEKVLDQFPEEMYVKAIHLINDYDAIWNGEVIEERLEMVKEKLGLS
jgi:hypothetical protein